MKRPLAISLGCHAALILAALLIVPAPPPFKVKEPAPIVVDISNIGDKVQQMATTKTDVAETKEPPAPKETKVVKDVPPAPKVADKVNTAAREPVKPPPEKLPDPKPDTKALDQMLKDDAAKQADLQQKADEKQALADAQKLAEDKRKAEDKKKADDKKKVDEKKKKLAEALAQSQAMLNKIAGDASAPAKPTDKKGMPKHGDKEAAGTDAAVTATIVSALVSKIKGCFTIPPAAREVNVSVPIHFLLNTDGSVNGTPQIVQDSTDPVFQATARAAISAIVECQTYDLPVDQYDQWKDNVLDFNPTQLSG